MMREPSKGGKGKQFKMPKIKLILMPATHICISPCERLDAKLIVGSIERPAVHKRAMIKFAMGPAMATKAMSRRGFFSKRSLTGTGLAQPNK